MRRNKRNFGLLIVSVLAFFAILYIVLNYSPALKLSILNFSFPILPLFFVLTFIFLYSLFTFILKSKRRGILIGLFVISYLVLRMNGLTNVFFVILLVVLFGSLELLFVKRK